MKSNQIILILALSFLGCDNNDSQKEKEYISKEKDLKYKIDSLKVVITQKEQRQDYTNFKFSVKKFAFVIIEISVPLMDYDTRDEFHFQKYREEVKISNIIEVDDFTKDNEQKLIDTFHEKVVFDATPNRIKIKKRKCYSFDTYEKASLEREKFLIEI